VPEAEPGAKVQLLIQIGERYMHKYFNGTVHQIFALSEAEPGAKVQLLIKRGNQKICEGTAPPEFFSVFLHFQEQE
jgi:hypothetical protein